MGAVEHYARTLEFHREHTRVATRMKDEAATRQQIVLLETGIKSAIDAAPDVFGGRLDPAQAARLIAAVLL